LPELSQFFNIPANITCDILIAVSSAQNTKAIVSFTQDPPKATLLKC